MTTSTEAAAEAAEFSVSVNPEYRDAGSPMLVGEFELVGKRLQFLAWENQTKDGKRIYYSSSVYDVEERRELRASAKKGDRIKQDPLAKTKLYEFRQRLASDPDFATTDSFTLLDETYYAAMWAALGDSDDPARMEFRVRFSDKPFRPALTEQAQSSVDRLREHLEKRRSKLPEATAEDSAPEKVNYDENGDPENLPF